MAATVAQFLLSRIARSIIPHLSLYAHREFARKRERRTKDRRRRTDGAVARSKKKNGNKTKRDSGNEAVVSAVLLAFI